MLTTILDEAVNGWILTVYGLQNGKQQFIYERLVDATEHRNRLETEYEYWNKQEVTRHA